MIPEKEELQLSLLPAEYCSQGTKREHSEQVLSEHNPDGSFAIRLWKAQIIIEEITFSFFPLFFWFFETGFHCSPGYPGNYSVNQVRLELRDPPASAFWVLGLKCMNHYHLTTRRNFWQTKFYLSRSLITQLLGIQHQSNTMDLKGCFKYQAVTPGQALH